MEILCSRPWPGNVRELSNVVRRARALAGDATIGVQHLALGPPAMEDCNGCAGESGSPLQREAKLKEIERRAILEALERHESNITRTARALGINRSTLRRKLREYGTENQLPDLQS
jgi:DNA-binding NtrC family response regulator